MPALTTRHRALRVAAFELLLTMAGILLVRREIWQAHVLDVSLAHWQEGLLLPLAAIDGGITGIYASHSGNVEHAPAYGHLLKWGRPLFLLLYVACAALSERLNIGIFTIAPELWRTLGITLVVAGLAFRLWSQISSPSAVANTAQVKIASEPEAEPTIEWGQPEATDPRAVSIDSEPATEQASEPDGTSADIGVETQTPQEVPAKPDDAVAAFVEKINAAGTPATSLTSAVVSGSHKGLPEVPGATNHLFPIGPHKLLRYPDVTGRLIALCGIPLCFNTWLPLLAVPGVLTMLKWHISDQEAFRISQLGEPYLEHQKRTWNLIPYIY